MRARVGFPRVHEKTRNICEQGRGEEGFKAKDKGKGRRRDVTETED